MIRKLFFLFFTVISFSPFWAQSSREISYGASVGVIYSKMDNLAGAIIQEGYTGYEAKEHPKFGFMGGISINWFYPDSKIAFQPELFYSSEGTDFKYNDVNGLNYTIKLKYQYLNFGFLFKYYFMEGLYLGAGPFLTLNLVKDNLEYTSNGEKLSVESNVHFEPDIVVQSVLKQSFEGKDYFHAGFGVGYEFQNGLNIGLRYHLGLSDAWATEENGHRFRENKNNVNAISLQLGYRFDFKGANNF